MKPHLLTDSGKIYVVKLPDTNDYPLFSDTKGEMLNRVGISYNTAYNQALANKIEVHPDCVDEARQLIADWHNKGIEHDEMTDPWISTDTFQEKIPYLIEGLKVEVKETCVWDGNRSACGNETCWDLTECQKSPLKQYAIISIEQLKDQL